MTEADLKPVIDFMIEKANSVPYGEISVNLKIHAGKPTLIEKSVVEKDRLAGYTGGSHGNAGR